MGLNRSVDAHIQRQVKWNTNGNMERCVDWHPEFMHATRVIRVLRHDLEEVMLEHLDEAFRWT